MRLLSAIVILSSLSIARAGDRTVNDLIGDVVLAYQNSATELESVKDRASAEKARIRLTKITADRDKALRLIVQIGLSPLAREEAQAKLDRMLKPASELLQKTLIRVSVVPEAIEVLQDLNLVQEIGTLIEERAKIQVRIVELALQTAAFRDGGKFPKKISEVEKYLVDKNTLRDPWGRDWKYDTTGKHHDGKKPDVWTVSPFGDGKRLIGNWDEKKK